MFCPMCGERVSEEDTAMVARVLGGFLTLDQNADLLGTFGEWSDQSWDRARLDSLCPADLVRLMAAVV